MTQIDSLTAAATSQLCNDARHAAGEDSAKAAAMLIDAAVGNIVLGSFGGDAARALAETLAANFIDAVRRQTFSRLFE